MLSARFKVAGQPFSVEEVEIPKIAEDDVLVEVKAAGICGSDVHYAHGEFSTDVVPLTLGHEGAGVVKEVGKNVHNPRVGDRVAVHYVISCGHCRPCLQGYDNRCRNRLSIGHSVDGVLAQFAAIPAANAIKIADNISFEQAAITGCGVSTAYHAMNVSGLNKGDTVVVFGLGGVGLHAVMWAKFDGAGKIIAVDPVESKHDTARKYGADIVVNPLKTDVPKLIMNETDGWGVDVAVECSGSSRAMEQAIRSIKGKNQFDSGTLVSVGLQTKPFRCEYWNFREGWLTVSGDHTKNELQEILSLIETGKVDLSSSITHRIPLREINRGIELLESNKERVGRVVVDMAKLT